MGQPLGRRSVAAGRVRVPGGRLDAHPYDVVLAPSEDQVLPDLRAALGGRRCALLTDSNVGPLLAADVAELLAAAGATVERTLRIPAGEGSKSLARYAAVAGDLARAGLARDAALVALGGGVVGDLGGFVAATYMRGITLVMMPTSLLAMVDSSVGGKVGVDLPEGKNLLGAFLRPRLVVGVTRWLDTLPRAEVSHGLAEVVKMGLLAGGSYLADLEDLLGDASAGDAAALEALILHAVRFKAGVVTEDEREGGRRAILNYGHTTAHGIEAATDYAIPHGRAVATGMRVAARIADRRFGGDLAPRHDRLLSAAGLDGPLPGPLPPVSDVLRAMRRDKKRPSGAAEHRFVLLEGPGNPVWGVPVSDDEVAAALEVTLA